MSECGVQAVPYSPLQPISPPVSEHASSDCQFAHQFHGHGQCTRRQRRVGSTTHKHSRQATLLEAQWPARDRHPGRAVGILRAGRHDGAVLRPGRLPSPRVASVPLGAPGVVPHRPRGVHRRVGADLGRPALALPRRRPLRPVPETPRAPPRRRDLRPVYLRAGMLRAEAALGLRHLSPCRRPRRIPHRTRVRLGRTPVAHGHARYPPGRPG
ncbi:hypothetical protein VTI74DRAFT_6510 [Chaetomium olivicolor]